MKKWYCNVEANRYLPIDILFRWYRILQYCLIYSSLNTMFYSDIQKYSVLYFYNLCGNLSSIVMTIPIQSYWETLSSIRYILTNQLVFVLLLLCGNVICYYSIVVTIMKYSSFHYSSVLYSVTGSIPVIQITRIPDISLLHSHSPLSTGILCTIFWRYSIFWRIHCIYIRLPWYTGNALIFIRYCWLSIIYSCWSWYYCSVSVHSLTVYNEY